MQLHLLIFALVCNLALIGCSSGGGNAVVKDEFVGKTANPMVWRATLNTLDALPVQKADPVSGIITYDWGQFNGIANERIKATVYILDTRLRADAVKVVLFKEVKGSDGAWQAADTNPATAEQLEEKILERARVISLNSL